MQENTDDEIYLTNLLDPAPTIKYQAGKTINKFEAHPYGSSDTRYILLTEDNSARDEQPVTKNTNAEAPFLSMQKLPYAEAVAFAARQTTLDPALLHAVIRTESAYNASALSPRGARGLMQLMPATASRFKVKNPDDPAQNVLAGAQYLRELSDLFKGDMSLALAAYNAGPNAVLRHGSKIPPYTETRLYVPRVLGLYKRMAFQTTEPMQRF